MIKRRYLLAATALMAAMVLGIAACGGSEAPAAEESPDAPEASEAAAEATATPQSEVAEAEEPDSQPTGRQGNEPLAPDLKEIDSWINSEPFTIESQRGKVVLIDFWTYTCVNCIRTLPYLKEWHAKYADEGLVIIGVHTPEFNFEKLRENVVEAVENFGIEYAVVQDNSYRTWNAYNNRFWPAKYLIDSDGYIRYSHFGEGAYDETEQEIRKLLTEAGFDISQISGDTPPRIAFVEEAAYSIPGMELTRELYAGYLRNYNALASLSTPPYILQQDYYDVQGEEVDYRDPGDHANHFIYLQGPWINAAESVIHARSTTDYEDYLAIKFFATSANAVLAPNDSPYDVRVTFDGRPLTADEAGTDIMFDSDGNSYFHVDEARMYRLVEIPRFEGHELKLSSNSSDMEVFAFTFGAYIEGP